MSSVVVTRIPYGEFVILTAASGAQWAEIEGILYVTDGVKTWEMREVQTVKDN